MLSESLNSSSNLHSGVILGNQSPAQIVRQEGAKQATAPMPSMQAALMTEEEAQEAMDFVQNNVEETPETAMGAHGGLRYDRVMALLAGLEDLD